LEIERLEQFNSLGRSPRIVIVQAIDSIYLHLQSELL
jgi:hypothetical protein